MQLHLQAACRITIPAIGIGAGADTDGQVLVYHDMLSYGVDRVAKFVKQYTNIDEPIIQALKNYVQEVKACAFPEAKHSYTMNEGMLEGLYGGQR